MALGTLLWESILSWISLINRMFKKAVCFQQHQYMAHLRSQWSYQQPFCLPIDSLHASRNTLHVPQSNVGTTLAVIVQYSEELA